MDFLDRTCNTGNRETVTPVPSPSRLSQDTGSTADDYACVPPHAPTVQNPTVSIHSAHTTELSEPSNRMPGHLSILTRDEELAEAEMTATEISTADTTLSGAQSRVVQELMRRISILENEVLTPETLSKLVENKETIATLLCKVRLTGIV